MAAAQSMIYVMKEDDGTPLDLTKRSDEEVGTFLHEFGCKVVAGLIGLRYGAELQKETTEVIEYISPLMTTRLTKLPCKVENVGPRSRTFTFKYQNSTPTNTENDGFEHVITVALAVLSSNEIKVTLL